MILGFTARQTCTCLDVTLGCVGPRMLGLVVIQFLTNLFDNFFLNTKIVKNNENPKKQEKSNLQKKKLMDKFGDLATYLPINKSFQHLHKGGGVILKH